MFSVALRAIVASETFSGVFMSFCAWNHGTIVFWKPKNPSPTA